MGVLKPTTRFGDPLTERERQCLSWVADGVPVDVIGRKLCLSPHTVKTHLSRSYVKLGVRDRAHAVAVAIRRGVIR